MLSLPELSETYKNSHPHYINPLAYFDVTDHELADLKREALLPYLENLEEKMVTFIFVFLSSQSNEMLED